MSKYGSQRLVWAAIEYALREGKSVTLIHKGNIMKKFTEGARSRTGGTRSPPGRFRSQTITERESWILGNKEANGDYPPRPTPR